jgi:predicted Holliday junction resolvase-like endonuclease
VTPSMALLFVGIAIGAVVVLLVVAVVAPRFARRMRAEGAMQSRAIVRGQIYEQLVPYLPGFRFNPKDAQFLGRPVDFVVFDGLDDGELRRIVFVEVKTGGAKLTTRERLVRDAIRDGHVEWAEIRADASLALPHPRTTSRT